MKTSVCTNFHVRVEPRSKGDFGFATISSIQYTPKEEEEACEEMVREIKRHVDRVGYIGVEYDAEQVCEFCGAQWTEDDDNYNGGCCSQDIENEPPKDPS